MHDAERSDVHHLPSLPKDCLSQIGKAPPPINQYLDYHCSPIKALLTLRPG